MDIFSYWFNKSDLLNYKIYEKTKGKKINNCYFNINMNFVGSALP